MQVEKSNSNMSSRQTRIITNWTNKKPYALKNLKTPFSKNRYTFKALQKCTKLIAIFNTSTSIFEKKQQLLSRNTVSKSFFGLFIED